MADDLRPEGLDELAVQMKCILQLLERQYDRDMAHFDRIDQALAKLTMNEKAEHLRDITSTSAKDSSLEAIVDIVDQIVPFKPLAAEIPPTAEVVEQNNEFLDLTEAKSTTHLETSESLDDWKSIVDCFVRLDCEQVTQKSIVVQEDQPEIRVWSNLMTHFNWYLTNTNWWNSTDWILLLLDWEIGAMKLSSVTPPPPSKPPDVKYSVVTYNDSCHTSSRMNLPFGTILRLRSQQSGCYGSRPLRNMLASIVLPFMATEITILKDHMAHIKTQSVFSNSETVRRIHWYGIVDLEGEVIIGTMIGANIVLKEHSRAGPHNVVITGRRYYHYMGWTIGHITLQSVQGA